MSYLPRNVIQLAWLLLMLLSPMTTIYSASSYIWLEEPTETTFPHRATWDNLRGKDAPSVIRKSRESGLSATYAFTVTAPGGKFNLWGRAFDPQWSSPARWRLDDGPWQTWEPGAVVDQEIADRIRVMQWRRWGGVTLTPGEHQLQLELTGPRKTGDMSYFVLDALLLVKGDFEPKGKRSPEEMLAFEQAVIKEKLSQLGEDSSDYAAQVTAIVKTAKDADLQTVTDDLRQLDAVIDRALEAKAVVAGNQDERLSGRAESVTLNGRTLKLSTQWSLPFEGKLWVGILHGDALYSTSVTEVSHGDQHDLSVDLPEGLPSGTLTVISVPVGLPMGKALRVDFNSPAQTGAVVMKPASCLLPLDPSLLSPPPFPFFPSFPQAPPSSFHPPFPFPSPVV